MDTFKAAAHPPMVRFWNDYYLPTSLDEALSLLARYDGRARVVAGGTDLFLDYSSAYQSGERPHVDALIDVTRMADANTLAEQDGWIVAGCGVTHDQIVSSPLIQEHASALAEACAVVGGPQVRHVATLVGNVAHALPAADGTIALMALGAQAQVAAASEPGRSPAHASPEWRPLASLFKGPGEPTIDPSRELITAVRFRPTGDSEGSAFARVMRPQGVALPILGMAARMQLSTHNSQLTIGDVAIAAGPVAPVPFRASRTEEWLRGKAWNEKTLEQAIPILLAEVAPRTSPHRATKEYRLELLPTLLRETLTKAAGAISN